MARCLELLRVPNLIPVGVGNPSRVDPTTVAAQFSARSKAAFIGINIFGENITVELGKHLRNRSMKLSLPAAGFVVPWAACRSQVAAPLHRVADNFSIARKVFQGEDAVASVVCLVFRVVIWRDAQRPSVFGERLNDEWTFDEDVEPVAVQMLQSEWTLLISNQQPPQDWQHPKANVHVLYFTGGRHIKIDHHAIKHRLE